jgi:intergrase/recombinase
VLRWPSLVGHRLGKVIIHKTNIDWDSFKDYVFKKYAESYARNIYLYARKYLELINNPSAIETFSNSKKNHILKSFAALSKYYGFYQQFKKTLKDYGVTWSHTSSVDSFFRIMNNSNSDVLKWYDKAIEVLDDSDLSMYLGFVLLSGLRKSEAVDSFNLMIKLDDKDKLNDYYNEELKTIEHFKYPDLFFRQTKNVFISMIPKDMIIQIVQCQPVTYETIRKRLYRRGLNIRIRDLRNYYATFMVRHGLIKEEVDLLQGRISKSIFVRHYWSPAISELRERVFKALEELKQRVLS